MREWKGGRAFPPSSAPLLIQTMSWVLSLCTAWWRLICSWRRRRTNCLSVLCSCLHKCGAGVEQGISEAAQVWVGVEQGNSEAA